jgi:hypothetical protein
MSAIASHRCNLASNARHATLCPLANQIAQTLYRRDRLLYRDSIQTSGERRTDLPPISGRCAGLAALSVPRTRCPRPPSARVPKCARPSSAAQTGWRACSRRGCASTCRQGSQPLDRRCRRSALALRVPRSAQRHDPHLASQSTAQPCAGDAHTRRRASTGSAPSGIGTAT